MTKHPSLIGRAGLTIVASLFVSLPAAAYKHSVDQVQQGSDQANRSSGRFAAPEIDLALLSSAVLVAGGVALILRDRGARRQLDGPDRS